MLTWLRVCSHEKRRLSIACRCFIIGLLCCHAVQSSLHLHQLHNRITLFLGVQGKQEDLASVVRHVKKKFGVESVYCWHALHAYWSGVSPAAPETQSYGSQIIYPTPTPG